MALHTKDYNHGLSYSLLPKKAKTNRQNQKFHKTKNPPKPEVLPPFDSLLLL